MANLGADKQALERYRIGGGQAPTVKAPCCGRRTDSDSVLDVRMVSGIDHEFLCDGCQYRLIADKQNDWTRSRLARAAGLGWPEIREHRAREVMAEEVCRDGRINRSEACARIRSELPERDIPGTEAPPGLARVRRQRSEGGGHGCA